MASTALNSDEITEFFDTDAKVKELSLVLANLIRNSKHTVVYTGAGLSTSAGIADFRGPTGVWTMRAKDLKPVALNHYKMPTLAHMAIKKLVDDGLVKYVVSQNVDGLHLKSGIPVLSIAELHGNSNKEYCKNCKKAFIRNYRTRTASQVHDHKTGRKCECGGELYDSIINFGENLPEEELENAEIQSKEADLAIVLGTSLRVSPACNLPLLIKPEAKLVICNLQKTPFDKNSNSMVIHARCDDLMRNLMEILEVLIPDFIFDMQFKFTISSATKLVKISDSNVELNKILSRLTLTDSKKTEYNFLPGTKFEKTLTNYQKDDELELNLHFNLLKPFEGKIILNKTSNVTIELNVTKSTMKYTLNN